MEDTASKEAPKTKNYVEFANLMDGIVYHANIFNYDKQFLTGLRSRKVRFDFSVYTENKSMDDLKNFLEIYTPQEQIDNLLFSTRKEIEPQILKDEYEGMKDEYKAMIKKAKDANKAIECFFNLLVFSLEEAEKLVTYERKIRPGEPHPDNIITCLLYLDGVAMINVDIVKLFSIQAPICGSNLPTMLFRILDNNSYDNHIQEIASHILSLSIMGSEGIRNEAVDGDFTENFKRLMAWTFKNYTLHSREQTENCMTSNFCLLLTLEECLEYFMEEYYKVSEQNLVKKMADLIIKRDVPNIIYECLFSFWNISNNKKYLYVFENRSASTNYIEKIIQAIRTHKIDKVARIGLMLIKNLLESQACLEILFDIKFSKTINILLTNKWNDPIIRSLLEEIFDFLEKNYKSLNSFDKYMKEIDSGIIKKGSLHTKEFWEDNYKEFEFNRFEYIRRLIVILKDEDRDNEQKQLVCFDLGEFARLYPGAAGILEYYDAKSVLLKLIENKNMELKNKALVCLQKIMMKGLKK